MDRQETKLVTDPMSSTVGQQTNQNRKRRPKSKALIVNEKRGRVLIYKVLLNVIDKSSVSVRDLSPTELETLRDLANEGYAKTVNGNVFITNKTLVHILKLKPKLKTNIPENEDIREKLIREIEAYSRKLQDETDVNVVFEEESFLNKEETSIEYINDEVENYEFEDKD